MSAADEAVTAGSASTCWPRPRALGLRLPRGVPRRCFPHRGLPVRRDHALYRLSFAGRTPFGVAVAYSRISHRRNIGPAGASAALAPVCGPGSTLLAVHDLIGQREDGVSVGIDSAGGTRTRIVYVARVLASGVYVEQAEQPALDTRTRPATRGRVLATFRKLGMSGWTPAPKADEGCRGGAGCDCTARMFPIAPAPL